MNRTITFSLDSGSIASAIEELEQFRDDFVERCGRLRRLVAERIQWSAAQGFASATVSDIILNRAGYVPVNDVQVTATEDGDVSIVIAEGTQAVFIEFGAGVYHNGAAGSSPHPWGAQMGYVIGSYGLGNGVKNAWGFYSGQNDQAHLVVTHGTPAAMPMYRGVEEAIRSIDGMVREVFG